MVYKDAIHTALVGVEKVHCLCPVANSNLHHIQVKRLCQ
jgi:hypothetical protein